VIRGHGAARWHLFSCDMLDGNNVGDGLAGANEHFFYYDAQQGDSEVINCRIRGPRWSAIQAVGRYTDRFKVGGVWQERYPFGALRIEDCDFIDVGIGGTACINIAGGGVLNVTVRNCDYSAGFGVGAPPNWPGMAVQCYTDHKAWELDPNALPGQGAVIARGYSMDPQTSPISPGLAGKLRDDGYGSCNSMKVIGGTWRRHGGNAPLFNFRDARSVEIVHTARGAAPLKMSGGVIMFCPNGLHEQCGDAGDGTVPGGLSPGYWQQAVFVGRHPPSTWMSVPVKMGLERRTLSDSDMDSWWQ
jgi:hypothetical protein